MAHYDEVADWYAELVRGRANPGPQPVFTLLGDVAGQRVCDLACGEGEVARGLAALGAEVTAIDISVRLLEYARAFDGLRAPPVLLRGTELARSAETC